MTAATLPSLVTHSGTFHCDDAFAYAVLCAALGLTEPDRDHTLTRTRDPAVIAAADYVWDVGAAYDAGAGRFDHHQRGAPRRDDGLPFSAAGLVWRTHGEAAVRALLDPEAAPLAPAIAAVIDAEVVRRIDAIDNGVAHPEDTLGLAALIEDCNPAWDSPFIGDPDAEDAAFLEATDLAADVLHRRVAVLRARLAADAVVLAAHRQAADPRILELACKLPWQAAVFAHDLPVLFAVYPMPAGTWMVDAMPPEPGSYAQRVPLPAAWAGLRDAELAALSGVADAVFVHPQRFVGGARSRAGALAMARQAIDGPVGENGTVPVA